MYICVKYKLFLKNVQLYCGCEKDEKRERDVRIFCKEIN